MGLIDGSRTSARDMETNYVVLTACFSTMHVYHHSVPTGGVYCARGGNVDSTDSSAAALRAQSGVIKLALLSDLRRDIGEAGLTWGEAEMSAGCRCGSKKREVNRAAVMASDSGLPAVSSQNLGITIAIISSFINGSTFVLQKKGILRSRHRGKAQKQ